MISGAAQLPQGREGGDKASTYSTYYIGQFKPTQESMAKKLEAQVEKAAVCKTKQNNKQNAPEQPMASASCILPSSNSAAAAKGGTVTSPWL
jgi:hypothetical protein